MLGTLAGQLSDLDALEGHVNDLLARLIPKSLGKRGRRVAMDLVALPYHGTVDKAHQGEVCRSKATCGTTHFFTYATAYAVVRGRRYTLACAGYGPSRAWIRYSAPSLPAWSPWVSASSVSYSTGAFTVCG